ncbi:hypothetical protein SZ25_00457 [Candidatus Arcanobacter lacustris]|uniref:TraG N-terminal Proteobacteria domain-containing protein n=1 Tax=Candidatus Arcanibacter lacustris TaxID=1607817 RepID=A0A0F5MNT1_9RICK|nr:hypothetical protein SZ25_00457 [Candidatus Arcanobacter lacustris]
MDKNIAKTLLISALPVSHQQIMNLSSTASDILQQNMMINAIDHALIDMSASSNAVASLQAYAQARADSQVSSSYDATARQAEKWVPLLKVVFQALYYGTFPLIFLVMLMPMGVSVLRSYFIGFIWLESWGPLYAILNRLMTASATDATKAATMLDGGTNGIALINQRGIDAVNADIANIAGSMAMAIPFLLPVIMGGAKAFSGLATSMLAVPQNAATHAAQEAVTGNISYGNSSVNNHSFDNVSALKKSSSAYIDSGRVQLENSDGGKTSINADGSVVLDQSGAFSNLPGAQIDTSSSEASELRNQASQSINMANDQSVASTMSKASAYDLTAQAITNHSFSKTSGDDYRSGLSTSQSDAFSKINEAGERFSKDNNISKDSAIKLLAGVSASGSKSLGGGKGSGGVMNTILGAIGLNGGLEMSGSTSKRDVVAKAQDFAERNNLSKAFDVASSAAYNKSFAMSDNNGNTLNDNIASSLSEANRLEESSRINFQKADSLNSSASNVESHSVNNRANEQQLFKNWLAKQNYGGKELGESGARDLLNSNTRQKQSALNSFVKRYKEENLSQGILNPNLPVLGSDIYDSPQSRSLENKYLNNSQIMRDENNQQIKNNHKINADGITTVHVQSLDKKIDHSNLEQVVFDEIRTNQSTIYNESTKPPTLKKEVNEKLDKGLFKSASDSVLDSVNIFKNNGPISSNNTTKDSSSKQDSELVDITDIVAANNLQNTAPNNNQQLENRHNSNKNSTTTAHVESVDKKIDHSDLEQGVPDTIRTNKSIIYNESEKPQTLTNEVNEKLDKGSFESTSDSVLDSVNIFNSGGPVNKANTAKGSSSKQDSQLVDTTDIVAANNLQNTVPVPMMQNSAVHLGGFKEDFRSSGKAPEGDNISNDLANIFSNNAHTQKEPELKIDIKKPKGNKGK